MSVLVRQFNGGLQSGDDRIIESASTDLDWLTQKADSHAANGWVVTWTGPAAFTATKARSSKSQIGVSSAYACSREFWIA
jgi:hypothetical protein